VGFLKKNGWVFLGLFFYNNPDYEPHIGKLTVMQYVIVLTE